MNRTQVSVTTRTVSTASHEGWELTFTHESNGTQESVGCSGTNGTGGILNASMNSAPPNSNVNFHGIGHDAELATDIFAEMEIILGGTE